MFSSLALQSNRSLKFNELKKWEDSLAQWIEWWIALLFSESINILITDKHYLEADTDCFGFSSNCYFLKVWAECDFILTYDFKLGEMAVDKYYCWAYLFWGFHLARNPFCDWTLHWGQNSLRTHRTKLKKMPPLQNASPLLHLCVYVSDVGQKIFSH